MRLTKLPLVVVSIALLGSSGRAWGLGKLLAKDLGQGFAEGIEPTLACTLGVVEAQGAKLIGQTSRELGIRLEQIDGLVEKRLLQVELGSKDIIDHGLDRVGRLVDTTVFSASGVIASSIEKVRSDMVTTLDHADALLRNRSEAIGGIVTNAIQETDKAIGARIDQMDEVAGRRLGNVDVIATKQRLGLELTVTRTAWLLSLVVFVSFVLWSLWKEYENSEGKIRKKRLRAGGKLTDVQRAWAYVVILGKPLLFRHALVGSVVAILLSVVPSHLPSAAVKEQAKVTQRYAADLQQAIAEFDWPRARFDAAQLEFLQPENAALYRAIAVKSNLLRDILGRPTALATPLGVAAIMEQVQSVERAQNGRLDPDAETVRAMILWRSGETRLHEQEAASVAARALWSSGASFTMAPMARLLVESYLHAPLPREASVDTQSALTAGSAVDAADLESTESLVTVIAAVPRAAPGSPFESSDVLFHFMAELERDSTEAFVAMVNEQTAALAPTDTPQDRRQVAQATARRNAKANEIIAAWRLFDSRLRVTPALAEASLVFSVFRANDVILSHALWFANQPATKMWPRALKSMTQPEDTALKLAIAPARVTWERRYAGDLSGQVRVMFELQEAQRFEEMERWILRYEEGIARMADVQWVRGAGPRQKDEPSLTRLEYQLQAANAAAVLGLYSSAGRQPGRENADCATRMPLALTIAGPLTDLEQKIHAAAAHARTKTQDALADFGVAIDDQLHEKLAKDIALLRARLLLRGPRLL
jgi:hypothetical protein